MTTITPQRRLDLFPITTKITGAADEEHLTIGECSLQALAAEHGTPLYVYDQATMDAAAQSYRQALARYYPAASGVTYAGKAFLCLAAAQWVERQGFWLDCTGAGELHIAVSAGVARSRILMHGVNKNTLDLAAAATQAGVVVVDNLTELTRLAALLQDQTAPAPDLWLRVRPGVAVATHAFRQTGQEDSKFGMSPAEVHTAVTICRQAQLAVTGLHFHQGSHFHDTEPIGPALTTVLDLIAAVRAATGWEPAVLSPGGGWGVAYAEEDLPQPEVSAYVRFIAEHLVAGCQTRGLTLPQLQLEPGRSLVARAGVAIYQVGALKQSASRRWVLIDGGMADNPRPALYGARYSALPVRQPLRPHQSPAWIGGPFCESGDILIHNLALADVAPGDYLAVPASGAYHLAMGSNYNGARRPAVLWLHAGQATVIQRREQLAELIARDQPLPSAPSV